MENYAVLGLVDGSPKKFNPFRRRLFSPETGMRRL